MEIKGKKTQSDIWLYRWYLNIFSDCLHLSGQSVVNEDQVEGIQRQWENHGALFQTVECLYLLDKSNVLLICSKLLLEDHLLMWCDECIMNHWSRSRDWNFISPTASLLTREQTMDDIDFRWHISVTEFNNRAALSPQDFHKDGWLCRFLSFQLPICNCVFFF